jgi:fatty-acid desaturase
VGKGITREYQRISPHDQWKFNRWLQANATLSLMLAVGMLAMAWATIRQYAVEAMN